MLVPEMTVSKLSSGQGRNSPAVRAKAKELAAAGRIKREFVQQMEATEVHPDVIVGEVFEALAGQSDHHAAAGLVAPGQGDSGKRGVATQHHVPCARLG